MINQRLEDITEATIRALIDAAEPESLQLDFKRDLPARGNEARHELCADVCALANTQGGDLVFGVAEDAEGNASALVPSTENADEVCLRLQDTVLNGVEPRVTGVQARAVPVAGGNVFVLRVPRSWNAPHRVRTNQHFFLREGRRKRQLDMPEIGEAFARATGSAEQIRNFRAERIARILSGSTPVRLRPGVLSTVHVIPLQGAGRVQLDPLSYEMKRQLPVMSGGTGMDFRLNLDGGVAHRPATETGCGAYTLLFRDGKTEAVRVFDSDLGGGLLNVPSKQYEEEILAFLETMLSEFQRFDIGAPFVLMYSLLRAGNAALGVGASAERWFEGNHHYRFDRDSLLYPDLIVSRVTDLDVVLRPLFDLVWQSAGQQRSMNYNALGRWT